MVTVLKTYGMMHIYLTKPLAENITISDMVKDLGGCKAIIYDILIWGKDLKKHDNRRRAIMNRIRENNLKLSPEKCEPC